MVVDVHSIQHLEGDPPLCGRKLQLYERVIISRSGKIGGDPTLHVHVIRPMGKETTLTNQTRVVRLGRLEHPEGSGGAVCRVLFDVRRPAPNGNLIQTEDS